MSPQDCWTQSNTAATASALRLGEREGKKVIAIEDLPEDAQTALHAMLANAAKRGTDWSILEIYRQRWDRVLITCDYGHRRLFWHPENEKWYWTPRR